MLLKASNCLILAKLLNFGQLVSCLFHRDLLLNLKKTEHYD